MVKNVIVETLHQILHVYFQEVIVKFLAKEIIFLIEITREYIDMLTGYPEKTCGDSWKMQIFSLDSDILGGSMYHLSCLKPNFYLKIGEKTMTEKSMILNCGHK